MLWMNYLTKQQIFLKIIIPLLLIPSLSWGLTFKNGQVKDGEIPGKPLEVLLKEILII